MTGGVFAQLLGSFGSPKRSEQESFARSYQKPHTRNKEFESVGQGSFSNWREEVAQSENASWTFVKGLIRH